MYTHVYIMYLTDHIVIDNCILCSLIYVQILITCPCKKFLMIFKEMYMIAETFSIAYQVSVWRQYFL